MKDRQKLLMTECIPAGEAERPVTPSLLQPLRSISVTVKVRRPARLAMDAAAETPDQIAIARSNTVREPTRKTVSSMQLQLPLKVQQPPQSWRCKVHAKTPDHRTHAKKESRLRKDAGEERQSIRKSQSFSNISRLLHLNRLRDRRLLYLETRNLDSVVQCTPRRKVSLPPLSLTYRRHSPLARYPRREPADLKPLCPIRKRDKLALFPEVVQFKRLATDC